MHCASSRRSATRVAHLLRSERDRLAPVERDEGRAVHPLAADAPTEVDEGLLAGLGQDIRRADAGLVSGKGRNMPLRLGDARLGVTALDRLRRDALAEKDRARHVLFEQARDVLGRTSDRHGDTPSRNRGGSGGLGRRPRGGGCPRRVSGARVTRGHTAANGGRNTSVGCPRRLGRGIVGRRPNGTGNHDAFVHADADAHRATRLGGRRSGDQGECGD